MVGACAVLMTAGMVTSSSGPAGASTGRGTTARLTDTVIDRANLYVRLPVSASKNETVRVKFEMGPCIRRGSDETLDVAPHRVVSAGYFTYHWAVCQDEGFPVAYFQVILNGHDLNRQWAWLKVAVAAPGVYISTCGDSDLFTTTCVSYPFDGVSLTVFPK
jgi:hypothetical protein